MQDSGVVSSSSPSDNSRLERLFRTLDVNGDGRVDVKDLSDALQKRGFTNVENRTAFARKLIDKSDVDSSGDITLQEFVEYAKTHEKKLRVVFTNIDRNKDGKIDVEEILRICKQLGKDAVSEQEIVSMFRRMSDEGDPLYRGCDEDDATTTTMTTSLEISWEDWRDYLILSPQVESLPDVLKYWRHATYLDVGEDTVVPDDFTAQELSSGMWWRHLVAGGIAGAVSRTSTAPLDRLKVFLQVQGPSGGGLATTFKFMLKEGGPLSLWRGNGINVLKIAPESALKFMSYEQGKRVLKGKSDRELRIEERFVAGSIAGATSQSVIYPLEVVKTRLALRKTGEYKTVVELIMRMWDSGGWRVFYRGYIPNLLGILPYAGIDLAVYETLKKAYMRRNCTDEPPVLVLLSCGTASSACGQIASYPLALVRTRLQASTATTSASMTGLFRNILINEGMVGLYRGIMPNFMKVAPAVSISYVVYEHTRRKLGVTMT